MGLKACRYNKDRQLVESVPYRHVEEDADLFAGWETGDFTIITNDAPARKPLVFSNPVTPIKKKVTVRTWKDEDGYGEGIAVYGANTEELSTIYTAYDCPED